MNTQSHRVAAFVDESFTEAYELHVDAIYRFVLRLLGNPTDAEDMTAETFLRAYQGWSELLDAASVRSWLFRIAYNGCIDLLRQCQRHPTISFDKTTSEEMTSALFPSVASTESPLRRLIRAESSEILRTALLKLRSIDRTALVLGELEGMTNREIAEIIQRSEIAVKSLRQRARKALRDEVLRLLNRRGMSINDLF